MKTILVAECGTCEKWAVGITGTTGNPVSRKSQIDAERGRCTEYHSTCHNKVMHFFESCPTWSPVDTTLATQH